MKHFTCFLLSFMLLLCVTGASAANTPTSQFGFQGWPYRQNVPCAESCTLHCASCGSANDCISCPECQAVYATAKPRLTPTPAPVLPAVTPAPQKTMQPSPVPAKTATPIQTTPRIPTATPVKTAAPQPTKSSSVINRGDYTTTFSTTQEQIMLDLLNRDRAANGLSALPLDAELSRIARIKSQDMRDNRYFAHESPTYGNAASMLKAFGYAYYGVGENIAHHATTEKAEAAFMSSTGHRGNILGSQWKKVGIGICQDENGFVYVTQLFVR